MNSLVGTRFGKVVVLREAERVNYKQMVDVRCDCGTEKTVRLDHLKSGRITSCGCFRLQRVRETCVTHGMTKSPLYRLWAGIKNRCHNPNEPAYKDYGGRGIKVCDEWHNDFMTFYNWAASHGHQKGLDIDRIDNNGDYEPGNCRFATKKQNARNRRNNVVIEWSGEKKTLAEWAELYDIKIGTLWARLFESKMSMDEAVSFKRNLDNETVLKIYQSTKSQPAIAKEFGVNPGTVWSIRHGKSYTHITGAKANV